MWRRRARGKAQRTRRRRALRNGGRGERTSGGDGRRREKQSRSASAPQEMKLPSIARMQDRDRDAFRPSPHRSPTTARGLHMAGSNRHASIPDTADKGAHSTGPNHPDAPKSHSGERAGVSPYTKDKRVSTHAIRNGPRPAGRSSMNGTSRPSTMCALKMCAECGARTTQLKWASGAAISSGPQAANSAVRRRQRAQANPGHRLSGRRRKSSSSRPAGSPWRSPRRTAARSTARRCTSSAPAGPAG